MIETVGVYARTASKTIYFPLPLRLSYILLSSPTKHRLGRRENRFCTFNAIEHCLEMISSQAWRVSTSVGNLAKQWHMFGVFTLACNRWSLIFVTRPQGLVLCIQFGGNNKSLNKSWEHVSYLLEMMLLAQCWWVQKVVIMLPRFLKQRIKYFGIKI